MRAIINFNDNYVLLLLVVKVLNFSYYTMSLVEAAYHLKHNFFVNNSLYWLFDYEYYSCE